MSRRLLVVTSDHVGRRMAGPAIRAVNLARELAGRGFEVTLAAPNASDTPIDGVSTTRLGAHDARGAVALARAHDAVVAHRLPPQAVATLAGTDTRVVYDLYNHVPHELLAAAHGRLPDARDDAKLERHRLLLATTLQAGDAFICASERQRDLWLGALGALGRLDHEEHARDASFRHLIDVVPFGIEEEPPKPGRPVLRGVHPAVDERSRVLLWAGGIWNWLDPLTLVRATRDLALTVPEVRLVFLGLERPNGAVAETTTAERAVALSHELGVHGTNVIFNDGWVAYEDRGAWLSEADVCVSAHFDTLETRFAFRTRVLDYLWAGLPVATTAGDVLADLVEEEGLGATLPPEEPAAWVAALEPLLVDEDLRGATRERVASVRARFVWGRVVEPLARLVEEPGRRIPLRRGTRLAGLRALYLGGRVSLAERGLGGTVAAAVEQRPRRTTRLR